MAIFDLQTVILIFAIALAGGILGLDRTAFGQFMISQPVFAAPFIGWLLGDVVAGMVIGAVLELIWVLDMPVGTFVPADATITAVSATGIAILGSEGKTAPDVIGFSIMLTAGMAPVTMFFDKFIRERNSRLVDRALSLPGEDPVRKLSRAHLGGLLAFFFKSFALCLFFIPAGLAAVAVFGSFSEKTHTAMALFVQSLPLLGAALVLVKLSMARFDRYFLTGFAVALAVAIVYPGHPLFIILLIVATGYIGARSHRDRR